MKTLTRNVINSRGKKGNMSDTPLVSVIIPAYNRARFFTACSLKYFRPPEKNQLINYINGFLKRPRHSPVDPQTGNSPKNRTELVVEATSKYTRSTQIRQVAENQNLFNPELTVSIARTAQEVESLREIWANLQHGPLASIDYLLTAIKFQKNAIRPHVIVIYRQGKPETLLVGLINDTATEIKFKGSTILRLKYRILGITLGGIIGNMAQENCAVLIGELNKSLKHREVDAVYFQEIQTKSHIYQLAQEIPSYLFRDHFPQVENHYKMTLFPSADDFYASKTSKQRYNLRRATKKLYKQFSDQITIRCFQTTSEIPQFCQEAAEISQKSWQSQVSGGLTNDPATRNLLSLLATRNQFLGYILYVEGAPCAYQYGFIHEAAYHLDYLGYDPKFEDYGIGTVLLLKVIEILCNDPYFKFFDFGWMSADYKDRFCDQVWKEANIYLFQPTFKGAILNIVKGLSKKFPDWKENLIKKQKK